MNLRVYALRAIVLLVSALSFTAPIASVPHPSSSFSASTRSLRYDRSRDSSGYFKTMTSSIEGRPEETGFDDTVRELDASSSGGTSLGDLIVPNSIYVDTNTESAAYQVPSIVYTPNEINVDAMDEKFFIEKRRQKSGNETAPNDGEYPSNTTTTSFALSNENTTSENQDYGFDDDDLLDDEQNSDGLIKRPIVVLYFVLGSIAFCLLLCFIHCSSHGFHGCSETFDAKWFFGSTSPREILCLNWTGKKVFLFLFYTTIIAALVCVELFAFSWTNAISLYLNSNWLGLSIAIFLYEPLFILLMVFTTTYPEVEPALDDEFTDRRTRNKDVAIVIACHKSSDVILTTIESIVPHLHERQIFVMDNGNQDEPMDDTRELLNEYYPNVHYAWNPYGNKTLAQYAGTVLAEDYSRILVIDDDVTLPPEIDLKAEWINDRVRGICYPIRAVHEERRPSMLIDCQEIEYKMSDYAKVVQGKYSTVLFPHGAISLWDRETLLEILRWHDTIFYAEDVKMGIWMQEKGYELRIAPEVLVNTDAPHSLCGPFPNYYSQRVRSWDMAEHAYAWSHFKLLFTTRYSTVCGTIWMKLFQFHGFYTLFTDWTRLLILIFCLLANWVFFIRVMVLVLVVNAFVSLVWNGLGYRRNPTLRSKWFTLAFIFPFYKILVMGIRSMGMLRCIFVYKPNVQTKPTIPVLETMVYQNISSLSSRNVMKHDSASRIPVWLSGDERYYKHQRESWPSIADMSEAFDDESLDGSMRGSSFKSFRSKSFRSKSNRSSSRRSYQTVRIAIPTSDDRPGLGLGVGLGCLGGLLFAAGVSAGIIFIITTRIQDDDIEV